MLRPQAQQRLVRQLVCCEDGAVDDKGPGEGGAQAAKEHPRPLLPVALPGAVQPACGQVADTGVGVQ